MYATTIKSHQSLAMKLNLTEAHTCCMEAVKKINMVKWQND